MGYGQGATSQVPDEGSLSPQANLVIIDRGPIQEWFVNSPDGLEHGFNLLKPPTGPADSGPVRLELVIEGNLSARINGDGQSVDFVAATGRQVVRYSKLIGGSSAGRCVP